MVGGIVIAIWCLVTDLPMEMRIVLTIAAISAIIWGVKGVLGIVDWWRGITPSASVILKTRRDSQTFWDDIKKAGHVWAFWYNGGDARNQRIFDVKQPKKLVLLDRSDDALMGYHSDLFDTPKDTQKSLIKDTAEAAERAGIKVKYWPSPMPFSMTFFEPESPTGRVQLEIQIPHAPLNESLSMVFHKDKHAVIYGHLLMFFDKAYPTDKQAVN